MVQFWNGGRLGNVKEPLTLFPLCRYPLSYLTEFFATLVRLG